MRYLFICNVHPGPLTPLAAWLARKPENSVMLATAWNRMEKNISGIRLIRIRQPEKTPIASTPDFWQNAAIAGRKAISSFRVIAESGFEPEIILLSTASGAALGLPDIFPNAFMVSYLEDFGPDGKRKNLLQCVQAMQGQMAFAFDLQSKKTFSRLIRMPIGIMPPCLETVSSSKQDNREGIVFSLKNLSLTEFSNWFEYSLQTARRYPQHPVILLAPAMAIQNRLREILASMQNTEKVSVRCGQKATIAAYEKSMLAIIPAKYKTADILEAMAHGCPVLAKANEDFLLPGKNCLTLKEQNFLDKALANPELLTHIGKNGQELIKKHFNCDSVIPGHITEILAAREKFIAHKKISNKNPKCSKDQAD